MRNLDGDGRIEIDVNIRHFRDDVRWHVVIFDALTGNVKNGYNRPIPLGDSRY